jgi:flagella basal body P-ring formation protein FlgA
LRVLCVALVLLGLRAAAAAVEPGLEPALFERAQALAQEASRQSVGRGMRVEVRVGRLDPRLRLAPCSDVRPYLPTGMKLWGASRIGLRCHDSAVRWNVFLPITVDVWGPAQVASAPLPAGRVLAAGDLRLGETLLSTSIHPVFGAPEALIGRALARPLAAGEAPRPADLRARQWFAAGNTVRIVAAGQGWRIAGEGQALAAGLEGQSVRVRTESGRIVAGVAVGEREVEVPL